MRVRTTLKTFIIVGGFISLAACSSDNRGAAAAQPVSSSPGDTSDPRLTKADLARIQGAPTAKTWFVIISDFQCPYCKQWHDSSGEALRREYVATGKIRVAYVNYPLGQHRQAVPTAEAAMCAGLQDKFWEYHDALFATQQRWQDLADAGSVLDSLARAVGLSLDAHRQCRNEHVMLPLIAADRDRATTAGARSTPTFLVDGQGLQGVYPMTALRPILDAAIARGDSR
jgi:protein-disulfide isomerase